MYSVRESAQKLGLDTSQVRRLLAKGEIKGVKLARDWVVLELSSCDSFNTIRWIILHSYELHCTCDNSYVSSIFDMAKKEHVILAKFIACKISDHHNL